MKNFYTLFLLLLLSPLSVFSQFTNDTLANNMVRDSIGTSQVTPLSATTSNGKTYVTWFDFFDNDYQMRMQLLDANGNKLWAPDGIIVSAFPQNSALYRYDLKVDNNDNAIVAFQDERNGQLEVVVYKVDLNGNRATWGNSGVSLVDSTAQGLGPTICITGSNDVIVAWNANVGSSKYISFQKIASGGTILWTKRIFDNTNAKKYSRAVMVPYGSDDFMMLYVQETGGFPGTSTMFSQHYDANGAGVWTLPNQVSTKTISIFYFPKIITDKKNGFYIAFDTSNPISASINDVYAQHVDSIGNLWSPSGTECGNSTVGHKLTGGFCYNDINNELYVSLQMLDGSQGMSGVSLQKLDALGNVLLGANAYQLIGISATYYAPVGIVDAGDGLITFYYYGGFGNIKIASVKTDYNGLLMWNYDPTICNFSSNKDDYSLGVFKNNQCVLVWNDQRNDDGIYAQNISGDGLFGIATSMNEINASNKLWLYPNPSSSPKIQLNIAKAQAVVISVVDMQGHLCYKRSSDLISGLNEIQLKDLNVQSGLYLISVATLDGLLQLKWMKE